MTTRPIPPRIRAEEIIRRLTEALPRPEVNRDQLQRALDDMQAALPNLDRAVKDMEPPDGLRAASYEARVTGGSSDSATERLAFTDTDRADRDALAGYLRRMGAWCCSPATREQKIAQAAYGVLVIVRKHSPRAPSSKDLREVSAANTAATECALTRENLGVWAKPRDRPSDLGLLPEPVPVSDWVYRFVKQHGRLPSPIEWSRYGSVNDDIRKQRIAKAMGRKVDVGC